MNDFIEFTLKVLFPILGLFIFMIILIIIPATIIGYYSSCAESKIYNQINHTNYTCGDFFWAGEQINQQTQTIKLIK
jgi:hypothetical protein